MSPITMARWAMRLFGWAQPHVQKFIHQYNFNLREAERCYTLRRYSEAVGHYAGALKDAERRRASAAKKMQILLRLSECLRRLGDWGNAEQVTKQAMALARQEAHVLAALDEMCLVKTGQGERIAALEVARRAYEATQKSGQSLAQLAERCGRLASLERDLGNTAAATELMRESVGYYEKSHGPAHPATATQMASLAVALQDAGQLNDALPILEQAMQVHQARLGATAPETLNELEHIGQIHYLQGRMEQAVEVYTKLARLKENVVGLSQVQHASFLMDAATVHHAAGHSGRAIEYLYTARQKAGRDTTLGPLIEKRLAMLADSR